MSQKVHNQAVCPHCMKRIQYLLPFEPLYTLPTAAALLYMTEEALRKHLSNHREDYPRRYKIRNDHRRIRLLTAGELIRIKTRTMRYRDPDGQPRLPDDLGD